MHVHKETYENIHGNLCITAERHPNERTMLVLYSYDRL